MTPNMSILEVRLATLGFTIVAGALLIRGHVRVLARLKTFFFEPTHPANLGLLRILIFSHMLQRATRVEIEWYAQLPRNLAKLPAGWNWTRSIFPYSNMEAMGAIQLTMLVASGFAIVGLGTRLTAVVAALSSVLVLAVPNFYFKVNHGTQLATLCALILAASPCGDALSLDSLWRRRKGLAIPSASGAYTVSIRFCWLLLGTTYLGPGLWKLFESGDLWFNGQRMGVALVRKLASLPEFTPTFNLIGQKTMFAVLGTATLFFEIGLFFLVLGRRTRVLATGLALGFHFGVRMTMGIKFPLTLPLMLLIDFPHVLKLTPAMTRKTEWLREGCERWLKRFSAVAGAKPLKRFVRAPTAAGFVVGAGLTLAMIVAFIPPVIDSFPVAVYPRFAGRNLRVPKVGTRFEYALVSSDGSERSLGYDIGHFRANRSRRFAKLLMSAKKKRRAKRVKELTKMLRTAGVAIRKDDRLVVYKSTYPVNPAKRTPASRKRKKVFSTQLSL